MNLETRVDARLWDTIRESMETRKFSDFAEERDLEDPCRKPFEDLLVSFTPAPELVNDGTLTSARQHPFLITILLLPVLKVRRRKSKTTFVGL